RTATQRLTILLCQLQRSIIKMITRRSRKRRIKLKSRRRVWRSCPP
ncbi:subtilase family protein, partial [Vibrio parahaemolyticus 861]